MKDGKTEIIITDDHKLFRRGIKALLSDFGFIGEVYEAGNGKELLEILKNQPPVPDLVLLDLRMPVMDGIETTSRIRELYPEIKIIILTMEDDRQIILQLINKGVNGYIMKDADPEELETAIRKVIETDFYFPSDISALAIENLLSERKASACISPGLTPREVEVLALICKEHTATEIAEKLFISVRTVEGHRRKIMEKTGTKNMAGLVIFALKNRLVKI